MLNTLVIRLGLGAADDDVHDRRTGRERRNRLSWQLNSSPGYKEKGGERWRDGGEKFRNFLLATVSSVFLLMSAS